MLPESAKLTDRELAINRFSKQAVEAWIRGDTVEAIRLLNTVCEVEAMTNEWFAERYLK